ncbi:MAG: T9SS type A sorting domain-containing protein [Saprospiraceae bacterium]|nr:T9SS type A sorting domain-containing protein [Saprospiraceae bacterium]
MAISGQQVMAKVFPNPTKERFNLVLDEPLEADAELVLMNAFGQTVALHALGAGLLNYEFGASNLTEGIYFLSVKQGKEQLFATRLVVQK